jgi:predicted nucleotidyltransferase
MDEVLAELVRDAEADPDTVAVVLCGSRSVGHERPDSDYDVHYVRLVAAKPPHPANVEAAVITLDELRRIERYWWTDALVMGQLLLDKTGGELTEILTRLGAADDVSQPYDAYLNALVRGKAAARRGDELGARLHAADSAKYLAEALAALDGRRPRFHDRLAGTLGDWEPRLLAILREPDVDAQLALFGDVRALMESHGVRTHDEWQDAQLR